MIDTEKIVFTLLPEHIALVECKPDTVMTLDEGLLSTRMMEKLSSQPLPMLCDLTHVVKMTRECRTYFAGPEHAKCFTRCALVITSPISRVIGNFFLGANKPLRPTRLFTNKEKAFQWLKEKED